MEALRLFTHALRQLTGNMGPALRLSALPWAVASAAQYGLLGPWAVSPALAEAAMRQGAFPWTTLLAVLAISAAMGVWVAVGWHRFVLLAEAPRGVVPPLLPALMGGYALRGLAIVAIMIGAGAAMGLATGLLMAAMPVRALILLVAIAVQLAIWMLGLRLSVSLPAAAVGEEGGLGAGWRALSGRTGTLALLVIALNLVHFGAQALVMGLLRLSVPLGILGSILTMWFLAMLGLSLMTTLYGHYVQGRPLV